MTLDSINQGTDSTISESTLVLLKEGEMEEHGVIPWSSNYAFLATITFGEQETLGIYKPRRGERPLFDFPAGTLHRREAAAYLLSESLGWGLVPPTVLRTGPYGPGSVQLFIDNDPELHYLNVYPRHGDEYRRIALFDVVANNADRKAGHCLLDRDNRVWSIDHGICFHALPKLRTVIWEFAGEPIPANDLAALKRMAEHLHPGQPLAVEFRQLLNEEEVAAVRDRLEALISSNHFPIPNPNRRNYPWPPI